MALSLERWGVRVDSVLFPIATGPIITGLAAFLAGRAESYAADVLLDTKLPEDEHRTARMATVRDDGGPTERMLERRQLGFNVWAPGVEAEQLARLLMAGLRTLPDGAPVTTVDGLNGPFSVVDEQTDLVVVDGVTLSHFFFTVRVTVRAGDLN